MYTRAGDKGQTGLYGPKRVAEELRWVQGRLLVAGADLASELAAKESEDRVPRIVIQDTKKLEEMIDRFQEKLPRLTSFILPGGTALSANLHLARSVCRRAERAVVSLAKKENINAELVPFLNRLSTYLFNAARYSNALEGVGDEVWVKD